MPVSLISRLLSAASRRDQIVGRYVIREVRRGRPLDEVLEDRYVLNRTTPEQRGRLLERPEVVEALGEHAIAELRRTVGAAR